MERTFFRRILLALVVALAGLQLSNLAWSQPRDLNKEILVYIQPSLLSFPANERGELPPNLINIPSVALRLAFTRFGVQTLSKALPDFSDNDTMRIEGGREIRIPRFSRIFRVRVNDETRIDSAIRVLSNIPGILFAERNMDARLFSDPTYGNQWHLNNTGQSGGGRRFRHQSRTSMGHIHREFIREDRYY